MRWLFALLMLGLAAPAFAADVTVKDGNTLQVGDITWRLDGIDAPEFDQMCIDDHADPWTCGVEARDRLTTLIAGRAVRCEDLGPGKTLKKRHLAVCTADGETDSLNQLMVRQGYALGSEADGKARYPSDQSAAKEKLLGLWKGCFVAPPDFRRWEKTAALKGASCRSDKDREIRQSLFPEETAMPPGCSIKAKYAKRARMTGHVGIYQMQGCRSYAGVTKPDRWFCSAEDAQAAGFRAAFNCLAGAKRRPLPPH